MPTLLLVVLLAAPAPAGGAHTVPAGGKLSVPHRTVLVLREVEGLAYKEIAEVMQCSEGTVMSRLFHARKRMQEMLRPLVEEGASEPPQQAGDGER